VARVALIVNPFATAVTEERLAGVEKALRAGHDVETRLTKSHGHARELAVEAADAVDAIVVFAGDGTYNEAINGAAGRLPFGFVPGGGASVLVRALGLPLDPVEAAGRIAEALAAGRSTTVDLGRVNDRRFCFSAGVGLDAEVVRRVDDRGRTEDGKRPGDLAFATELIGLLAHRRLRLEPQLEIVGHGRAAFVLAACGQPYTYAGPMPLRLARGGGTLSFAAPERVTPASLPRLVFGLGRGALAATRGVLSGRGLDGFRVRCDRPLPLQVDGEDLGDVDEAEFEADRGAPTALV